jgi:lipopolysaccharide exporter
MWQFLKHFLDDIKTDLYHSSLLMSGNIVTQVIAVATYPILTRLYSADLFGKFSLFLSITGILTIISTARLEYALMLPDNEKEVKDLTKISIRLCLIFSLTCFVLSLILGQFKPIVQKIPGLFWIGFYVFLSGIIQIFVILRNRQKQYKTLAKILVLQNSTSSGIKIGFGFTKLIGQGLIWGNIIGQFVTAVAITKGYWKQIFREKTSTSKATLQKYSAFPRYRMAQALINTFSSNVPIFFITFYFSEREAGFYALVFGLAFKAITLVSPPLYQVLYQKFTNLKQEHKPIVGLFFKIISLLFIVSFIPGVFIFIFSKPLVSIFLGNNWIDVSKYIQMMIPWLLMVFVASPFAFIADVFTQQKNALLFDIAQLIIRLAALYTGFWFSNIYLSIILFSLSGVIFQIFLLIWYFSIITSEYTKNSFQ